MAGEKGPPRSESMYMYTISAIFGHTVNFLYKIGLSYMSSYLKATNLDLIVYNRQLSTVPILNKMFVIQVEIEDQPPVVEDIDEQVYKMQPMLVSRKACFERRRWLKNNGI